MEITNADVIAQWNSATQSDIERHGDEGDFARQHLLNPALFALLGDVRDKHILDAGCGQGYLTRWLARLGARVTGLEPATNWYHYALEREQREPLGITYLQADLSTCAGLEGQFDCVISNMVLMDIPAYQAAMRTCIQALKSGGDFIFSLTHPCFEESSTEWERKGYVEVRAYFQERAIQSGYGYWFHRPLSSYLNLLIHEGCIFKQMIEPQLDATLVAHYGRQHERNVHVPQFLLIHAQKA